ncbi:hypothetical protein FB451DRAFT_1170372 [Mycena latifolia]|nr:hypothetical protein FB451DRAFT_1170372 [Mycena latifolia]
MSSLSHIISLSGHFTAARAQNLTISACMQSSDSLRALYHYSTLYLPSIYPTTLCVCENPALPMAPNHKPMKKTAVAEIDEDCVSTGMGELESDEESAAADSSHSGEGQGCKERVAAGPVPEGPSMLTPSNDRSMVGQTRYSYKLAMGSRDVSVAWVASLLTTASTAPTTVASVTAVRF